VAAGAFLSKKSWPHHPLKVQYYRAPTLVEKSQPTQKYEWSKAVPGYSKRCNNAEKIVERKHSNLPI